MSWEAWQDPKIRQFWAEILDRLDAVAQEVAIAHSDWSCSISRTQWDAPNLELRWSSHGLERNVNMLIVGISWPIQIEFTAAAWLDSADGRVFLRSLDLPVEARTLRVESIGQLAEQVGPAIESAASQVDTIRRAAAASGD